MSLFFDKIKDICDQYDCMSKLSRVIAYITPFIVVKEYLHSVSKSLIPSYVERIVHFDTKYAKIHTKYVGRNHLFSMKRAHPELMELPQTGYYVFHVWNQLKVRYEYYVLRADLLTEALGIKNINYIWALHDYGVIQLLSNFVEYSTLDINKKIIGISINNNQDITKLMKPYMGSIHIPNNITPMILYMLTQYLKSERTLYIDALHTNCIYHDEELNDVLISKSKEYIIKPKDIIICPDCCDQECNYNCKEDQVEEGEEREEEVEEDNTKDEDEENEECDTDKVEEIFETEISEITPVIKDKDV